MQAPIGICLMKILVAIHSPHLKETKSLLGQNKHHKTKMAGLIPASFMFQSFFFDY